MLISAYNSLDSVPQRFIELLDRVEEESVFLGRDWFKNFYETVATNPSEVHFYCLQDDQGQALAMLPMWSTISIFYGIRLRKLTGLSNYYSPIFDVFYEASLITREGAFSFFLAHLWKNKKEWDLIDVFPLGEKSKDAMVGNESIKPSVFCYFLTTNFYQTVNENFQQYIGRRPSRVRNTIRRKTRKLDRLESWNMEIYTGDDDIESKLADYHQVYLSSWKADEPYPDFINGLVRLAAANGWLRLGILRIGETVVAVQLWLVANSSAYIYKLAYDKKYSAYSPGTILTSRMIQQAIEVDQVKKIDFLTGQDSFKLDWMDSCTNLYGVQITNCSSLSGIFVHIVNKLSQLRRSLPIYTKLK